MGDVLVDLRTGGRWSVPLWTGSPTRIEPSAWTALILMALIAGADWYIDSVSIAFLYLIPTIIVSRHLAPWGVVLFASACTLLGLVFAPHAEFIMYWSRAVLQGTTLVVAGLFASRMEQNRRRIEHQFRDLERQAELRAETEEQLEALINTSVTAILTTDSEGTILLANQSAKNLFAVEESRALERTNIAAYLPFLASARRKPDAPLMLRTMVEGRAVRTDGSAFLAQAWVSSYQTTSGFRRAVIAWDASEQRREIEELGLRQLMMSSHILTGAVAHEVRNLSAAISVLHHNLTQVSSFAENLHFRALGTLVTSLREFASTELRSVSGGSLTEVDVNELLDKLASMILPLTGETGTQVHWEARDRLPPVRAEESALLQVLLNIINNARRAIRGTDSQVSITAYQLDDHVVVRISNDGPQIEAVESLFEPFQSGANSTGLGLYVSRAILRTFGAELRYTHHDGCNVFLIELACARSGADSPAIRASIVSDFLP